MLEVFLASTAVVALAEIGDKTMLLAIVLAAKLRAPWQILAGIFAATIANHAAAAFVGDQVAGLVDAPWFRVAVALGFIAMAGWTLIPDKFDEDGGFTRRGGAFLTTLVAFFLVEMGDKTQIATIALGAQYHAVAVVAAGTTLGMMIANTPAVFLGEELVKRVSLKATRIAAAVLFLALGLWQLAQLAGAVLRIIAMWLLDKLLKALIRKGRLTVTDHDGKVHEYGEPGGEALHIRFTEKGTAMRIARDPRVGAGEAYMDGRLVVEPPHDIRDFVLFADEPGAGQPGVLTPRSPLRRLGERAVKLVGQLNDRAASRRNVVHHYGLTRQFYELFLDADRQYSMAYYRDPASTLERAQLDKKALIAAKLRLGPKSDGRPCACSISAAAGAVFGLYVNRHYGCEVLGVSLAPDQVAFANERAVAAGVADKVRFELIDYRDVTGRFDRISSIGMIEHLGQRHYDEYFAKTNALLAPDGIMLTHTIGRRTPPGAVPDKWSSKYIFPGHYLPSLSEFVGAAERTGWEAGDAEVLRYHYALTLAEWYRRATLHRAEIEALFDARMFRMWQFYLAGTEQAFRHGAMVNFQLQTVKRRGALPMTRDYILEEFARLSAADEAPEWHLENKAAE